MNSYRANLKLKYPDCWQWISLARRIPGRLAENEANLLFQLARARTPAIDPVIVEIGAGRGKTSLFLAAGLCGKTRPRLFSIQRAGDQLDQQALHRNLSRCRLGHIVDSTEWTERKSAIDILFINATPDHATLHGDLSLWSPLVKLGGLVILHGISPELPEYFQPPRYSRLRHIDSLTWGVKQCAASLAALPAATELERLRLLLNRSIEAMLYLNIVPDRPDEQQSHPEVPTEQQHLEDATELALARLQDYVRRATREVAENRHAIQALYRSWSWRLTAPLRLGIEALHAIAGFIGSFAHGSPKTRIVGLAQWILFGKQVRASGLLDERYYRDQTSRCGLGTHQSLAALLRVRG